MKRRTFPCLVGAVACGMAACAAPTQMPTDEELDLAKADLGRPEQLASAAATEDLAALFRSRPPVCELGSDGLFVREIFGEEFRRLLGEMDLDAAANGEVEACPNEWDFTWKPYELAEGVAGDLQLAVTGAGLEPYDSVDWRCGARRVEDGGRVLLSVDFSVASSAGWAVTYEFVESNPPEAYDPLETAGLAHRAHLRDCSVEAARERGITEGHCREETAAELWGALEEVVGLTDAQKRPVKEALHARLETLGATSPIGEYGLWMRNNRNATIHLEPPRGADLLYLSWVFTEGGDVAARHVALWEYERCD